jgi:sugar phosphate isomerase/epimerase
MTRTTNIAVHAKPYVESLGIERGIEVLAQADIAEAVVWAGEAGEHLTSVEACRQRGIEVLAVALPKVALLHGHGRERLSELIRRARDAGAPAASLIFADQLAPEPAAGAWEQAAAVLGSAPFPIFVENNGRPAERFGAPQEIARLAGMVPGLRIALDLGHLASSGRAGTNVAMLIERCAWVEVHDNDGQADLHLPLGKGTGPGAFTSGLDALGFAPDRIVIETDARRGSDVDAWRAALRADIARLHQYLDRRKEST